MGDSLVSLLSFKYFKYSFVVCIDHNLKKLHLPPCLGPSGETANSTLEMTQLLQWSVSLELGVSINGGAP